MGGISDMVGGIFGGGKEAPMGKVINEPWGPQQPYLLEGFRRAREMLDRQPLYSQDTQQGLDMMSKMAREGSPLYGAAIDQMMKTLGGDYLYGNKESQRAIDAITQNTMNRVMPSLDSKFAASGRYGSGLHKQALGQAIADTSAGAMAQNYANERQNQMRAGMLAPQIAQSRFGDIERLLQVGGMRDEQLNWRDKRLMDYMSLISGNYGGTSTQMGYRNPLSGALGGAITGGSMFGLPGAIGGGLIGFLGL